MNTVYDSECIEYIDKPIAFASHALKAFGAESIKTAGKKAINYVGVDNDNLRTNYITHQTTIEKWNHDTSKRKIGYIRNKYDDGGVEVVIFSNDRIDTTSGGNVVWTSTRLDFLQSCSYALSSDTYDRQHQMSVYPITGYNIAFGDDGIPQYRLVVNDENIGVSYDATLDYNPNDHWIQTNGFTILWTKNRIIANDDAYTLTDDEATTLVFGSGVTYENPVDYPLIYKGNPLKVFAGNFYQYACDMAFDCEPYFPPKISGELFPFYIAPWKMDDIRSTNLTAIPYNLMLTYDKTQALDYLHNGNIPSDAFLFPLDFNDLPIYSSEENDDSDEGDDDTDDIDDGEERDCDENLPEVPPYTGGSMNNNNVFLLLPGELNDIIDWFWNDVGAVQDLDDLMTKIEGLANNLAQNFLMFRIMPVNPAWIGGYGTDNNFVVGGVEKSGTYKTLGKRPATVEEIGHWHFSDKYTSYKFLNYEPYSDIKLYLPYHGIVDLDVGVYQGHDLYVKAVYDYLSGTITYLLYCDNTWLTNTFTAKMCVDLNISLQSKNERDNAIYGNVTNAVAGIMGAGSTLATGNPIGLAIGANAILQQGQSAPYKVMASVGEDGAFYAPQKCAVLIRRPKVSRPKTYRDNIGRQAFESRKLSTLKGKGFTTVINPRFEFSKLKPLPEEAEELNQLLTDGVFL